ncbi:hypothetical protein ACOME3_001715 [Neoechinorhynchus agilis]
MTDYFAQKRNKEVDKILVNCVDLVSILDEIQRIRRKCEENLSVLSFEQQKLIILIGIANNATELRTFLGFNADIIDDNSIFLDYLTDFLNELSSFYDNKTTINVHEFCSGTGIKNLEKYFRPHCPYSDYPMDNEDHLEQLSEIKMNAVARKFECSMKQPIRTKGSFEIERMEESLTEIDKYVEYKTDDNLMVPELNLKIHRRTKASIVQFFKRMKARIKWQSCESRDWFRVPCFDVFY